METAMPNVVYHYCSLPTFLKIFKTKTIWLSDISKSNDSMELKWYFDQYRNWLLEHGSADDKINLLKARNGKSIFSPESFTFYMAQTPIYPAWAFCLSEEGDSLSQWRAYSDNGYGISIGFNAKYIFDFSFFIDKYRLVFKKVSYSEQEMQNYFPQNLSFEEVVKSQFVAPFFKNPSFSEEKEWRLVIIYYEFPFEKVILPDQSKYNSSLFKIEQFGYNVNNNQLVSHFELVFNDLKKAIKEIIIGPKSRETVDGIKLFLVSQGLLNDMDDDSISVRKSTSSYQ